MGFACERFRKDKMSCYIAIKDKRGEYKHYEVNENVYYYIRQLESYIRRPEMSKLKEVYCERFRKDKI